MMGNSQGLLWKIFNGVMFLSTLEIEVWTSWHDAFYLAGILSLILFRLDGWFLIFASGTRLLFQKLFGMCHVSKQCFDHI